MNQQKDVVFVDQKVSRKVVLVKSFRSLFYLAGALVAPVAFIAGGFKELPWYYILLLFAMSTMAGVIFFYFLVLIMALVRGRYRVEAKENQLSILQLGTLLKSEPDIVDLEKTEAIRYHASRCRMSFEGEGSRAVLYLNSKSAFRVFDFIKKHYPEMKGKMYAK